MKCLISDDDLTGISGLLLVLLLVMATIATERWTRIPIAMARSKNNRVTCTCRTPNLGPKNENDSLTVHI